MLYEDLFLKSGLFEYNIISSSKAPPLLNQTIKERHLKAVTSPEFRKQRSEMALSRLKTESGRKQLDDAQKKARNSVSIEKIRKSQIALAKTENRKSHLEHIASLGGIANAEKARKPILCVETGHVFGSIKSAARHLVSVGLTKNTLAAANIQSCASGRKPSAYGYTWKFVTIQRKQSEEHH